MSGDAKKKVRKSKSKKPSKRTPKTPKTPKSGHGESDVSAARLSNLLFEGCKEQQFAFQATILQAVLEMPIPKAAGLLTDHVQANPDDVDALSCLGWFLQETQDFTTAKEVYRKVLAKDPNHVQTLRNFGFLLHLQAGNRAAEKMYRRVLEVDPEDDRTMVLLGHVLRDDPGEAQTEEAEVLFRRALTLDPANSVAHALLGALLEQTRLDYSGARQSYVRSLSYDDHPAVRQRLKELKNKQAVTEARDQPETAK